MAGAVAPGGNWGVAVMLSVASGLLALVWAWIKLRSFARQDTPVSALVVVFSAWFLGFSALAVLLPLDLALDAGANAALLVLWQINYWVTLLGSWVVLPIVMEYWAAGEFTAKARLLAALRHNAKFYLYAGAALCGAVLVLGLRSGFEPALVSSYLVAAANAYGMALVVLMLGYGLVEVPREVLHRSDPRRMLVYHYVCAPVADQNLLDAQVELAEVVAQVRQLNDAEGSDASASAYACVRALAEAAERECLSESGGGASARRLSSLRSNSSGGGGAGGGAASTINPSSLRRLAALHYRLKKAVVRAQRAQFEMANIGEQTAQLEQLVQRLDPATSYHRLDGSNNPELERLEGRVAPVPALTLRYRHSFWRGAGWALVVLSLVLLYNECVAPFVPKASLFALMLHAAEAPGVRFLCAALPLAYMAICVYAALFKFKLLESLALHRGRQTDAYCLLANASYLGRLQFSLGVNYIAMLHPEDVGGRLAFQTLVGDMDAVPFLGSQLSRALPPLLIALLAVCTFFNLFDKLAALLGIETNPDPGQVDTRGSSEELERGKQIVERNRARAGRRAARAGRGSSDARLARGEGGASGRLDDASAITANAPGAAAAEEDGVFLEMESRGFRSFRS